VTCSLELKLELLPAPARVACACSRSEMSYPEKIVYVFGLQRDRGKIFVWMTLPARPLVAEEQVQESGAGNGSGNRDQFLFQCRERV
jgi:hypothetical protein